jgi:hypothetical protein
MQFNNKTSKIKHLIFINQEGVNKYLNNCKYITKRLYIKSYLSIMRISLEKANFLSDLNYSKLDIY